jgi:diguanylate cyclase (GGDEF)-like protein
MTGSRFTMQTALPGLAAGSLGLVAGFLGSALHQPALGAGAGILALAAGLASVLLAKRLDDQAVLHAMAEGELRSDLSATTNRTVGQALEAVIAATPAAGSHDGADTNALVDQATGLFSETFFRVALDSRIAAARRHLRPISVVLLEVVEGLPANDPRPVDAQLVSSVIKETLREADTACRLRTGYFALLLEDTPENGAIWTVERIRRQLPENQPGLTVWAGVACYPAHAFNPEEILSASEKALVSAREWRQDRIEVAVAAD